MRGARVGREQRHVRLVGGDRRGFARRLTRLAGGAGAAGRGQVRVRQRVVRLLQRRTRAMPYYHGTSRAPVQ